MRLTVSTFSHKGPRSENQDRAWGDESRGLIAVADGMGGERNGAETAEAAISAVPGLTSLSPEGCSACLDRAHEAAKKVRGGGSTLVFGGLRADGMIAVGWAGDSRGYLIDPAGNVRCLTLDHNLAMQLWLRDEAQKPASQRCDIRRMPHSNVLTCGLGVCTPPHRVAGVAPISFEAVSGVAPCTLILVSDGVWGAYPDEPTFRTELVRAANRPKYGDAAQWLVEQALQQPKVSDNATAAVLVVR